LQALKKLHARLSAASYTSGKQDWEKLFRVLDREHTGSLRPHDMQHAVRHELKVAPSEVSDEMIDAFFQLLDQNRDGRVELSELLAFMAEGADAFSMRLGDSRTAAAVESSNESAPAAAYVPTPQKARWVTLHRNGQAKALQPAPRILVPSTIDALLEAATRKLQLATAARQAYTSEGKKVESVHQIEDEAKLWFSCGEALIPLFPKASRKLPSSLGSPSLEVRLLSDRMRFLPHLLAKDCQC
jgi:hypothetical protein